MRWHLELRSAYFCPGKVPIRTAAEDLILIWTATNEEEWTDRIEFLPI